MRFARCSGFSDIASLFRQFRMKLCGETEAEDADNREKRGNRE